MSQSHLNGASVFRAAGAEFPSESFELRVLVLLVTGVRSDTPTVLPGFQFTRVLAATVAI